MSSSDASLRWAAKYVDIVQRIALRPEEGASKLALSRRNLDRARTALHAGDLDQAVICAETAMVNAADAVIASAGYRIRGKSGSHLARFAYPGLPRPFADEALVLSAARRARNRAQYEELGSVSEALATESVRAAERLVEAAEQG